MSYYIYADASIDILPALAKQYAIQLVPMHYELAGETFSCTALATETQMHEYYEKQRRGAVTHTSQVGPANYMDIFRPLLEQGEDILCLTLSSGLSSTYQSALMAAEELSHYPGKLFVIDSLGATAGLGLLAELAGKNKEEGLSIGENADRLMQNRLYIAHHFMVDDLMYLQRGGRISASAAIVGSMLNVKPLLRINETGSLEITGKRRGIAASWKELVSEYEKNRDPQNGQFVYLLHADCSDLAVRLRHLILERCPDSQVCTLPVGPIIGAHTGPGMMALAYWGKR